MLPVVITVGPLAAANAALLAASQTPVSGTPLTLTGAQPDVPRRISLAYGGESAPRTLVLTGTNWDGNPIQETLLVPATNFGTVASVQDFKTLVSALPLGGGWTNPITLGTNTVGSSEWKLTNHIQFAPAQISWNGVVSGTVNWSIEVTMDNPIGNFSFAGPGSGPLGNYPPAPNPILGYLSQLTGQDGNAFGSAVDTPIMAWRPAVNSGSGSVTVTALEAGVAAR